MRKHHIFLCIVVCACNMCTAAPEQARELYRAIQNGNTGNVESILEHNPNLLEREEELLEFARENNNSDAQLTIQAQSNAQGLLQIPTPITWEDCEYQD